jgi:hypothetical protein
MGNGKGNFLNLAGFAFAASLTFALIPGAASADALHVFCTAPTPACTSNGSITPTSTNPPTFGFKKSPDTGTADFLLAVLIPNSVSGADSESFTINGTFTGNAAVASSLFSTTAWASDTLETYLSIPATPINPIGALLPLTQFFEPSATGYFVYKFDFGLVSFGTNDPVFATSFVFPIGSIVTAFVKTTVCHGGTCTDNWVATANSSALIVTNGTSPPPLPEPATIALLGAGLGGLGFLRRKRKAIAQ